jgi:hypothetical protein
MPSLEELSRRYAEAQRREREEGPNAGGVVRRERDIASERALLAQPPATSLAIGSAELHGHIEDDADEDDEVALDADDDGDTDTAASG